VRLRRALWPLLASVVFVGVLFAGVFPTRTYLAQRASISHAEKQLSVLGQQNGELRQRAKELQTDAEIERLAREQYNLVKPGEDAYAILPPPVADGQPAPATPGCSSSFDGG
jgi:cell division protein FtsB